MRHIDIRAPDDLEGTKSVVANWLKRVGDAVDAQEPLVELETDKVSMEVSAPTAGTLTEVLLSAGEPAEPGALLGRLQLGANQPAPAPPRPGPGPGPPRSIAEFDPNLRLSPSVRRLLMETGADPSKMTGTGRNGRLTRQDVLDFVSPREAVAPAPHVSTPASRPPPQSAPANEAASAEPSGRSRLLPHSRMRLSIAEHMSRSVATAPHVTAIFEADFGAVMAHRQASRAEFEAAGVSLTYTAYIVAACVEAMRAVPAVNSRWRDDGLELFDDINIAVGTALGDKGLVAPVIHGAQSLSLLGIARRLDDLIERARGGRLAPADMQNGTFSISNHGVSGALVAAPIIINQPQSAILGVGKLEKRIKVREVGGSDALVVRPTAYVSLTIDHRALDGHQTNAWLTRFCDALETWPAR